MGEAVRSYLAGLTHQFRTVRSSGRGRSVRVPWVALSAAAAVLLAAAATRPLGGTLPTTVARRWGWSAQLAVDGAPWRAVTAIPLTRDPFMLMSMVLSLLLAVGALECLVGRRGAALTFLGGAVGGYLGVSLIVLLLRESAVVEAAHWTHTLDYGASAGIAACSAVMAVLVRRRLVFAIAVAVIVGGLVLHHQIADWEHAFSFSAAAGLTYFVLRRASAPTPCSGRRPEVEEPPEQQVQGVPMP